MRTTERLGIKSVGVFSEADVSSMHMQQAREAFLIGKAPSSESYLFAERVIQVAKQTGAQVRTVRCPHDISVGCASWIWIFVGKLSVC